MKPRHQVSRAAIELIKRFEGYRRKAAQLPDGRWTIGYGHTLSARQGAEVSETDAEALLLYDLIAVAHTVSELAYAELTQNQFDALCAFAFSIGLPAFRSSDVLKRVNEGAFTQAAFALELWRKAEFEGERIVIDAMVRRRAAEKLLFLTPPGDAWRPVPSAVLKPELDEAAPDTAPREAPAEIAAPLEGETAVVVLESAAAARGGEPASPVTAAAEAVSARLQVLFAEPEPTAAPEAEPEPAAPEAGEEDGAATAHVSEPVLSEPAEAEPPGEPAAEEEPMPRIVREPASAFAPDGEGPRIVIDDTAPYEFVPPPVQPIETATGEGPLVIVSLTVLGLAFFAGGVFWALNAHPAVEPGVFTPLLVGWLAGLAGVGFVAAAVFMLLQRMTRAAERRDRRKR
jgi:lysozyme